MTAANDTPRAAQAHATAARPSTPDIDTAQVAIERAHAITDAVRELLSESARDGGTGLAEGTLNTLLCAALAELEVATQCLDGEMRP